MFTNYYGQTKEQYDQCRQLIDENNYRAVSLVTLFCTMIFSILAICSLFVPSMRHLTDCYAISLGNIGVFWILRRFCRRLRINLVLQFYFLITIILISCTLLSIEDPTQKGTAFPVLIVLIPILFIDTQKRMSAFLAAIILFYCVMVLKNKEVLEANYDIVSSITFGGGAMFAHYFFNVKIMRSIVTEWKMQNAIATYKMKQSELLMRAEKDQFTGLYNRETFMHLANKHISDVEQLGGMLIVGILDVDRLKEVNDRFGHQAGDDMIKRVSAVLQRVLRRDDLIGRLGGDEYIFILDNVQDKEIVKTILKRMLTALNQIEIADQVRIGASVGITMTDQLPFEFQELYNRADIALYKAKELGGNQYCFYEDYNFIE